LPFMLFYSVAKELDPLGKILFSLPVVLLLLTWLIVILLSRRVIFPPGERFKFRFLEVWRHFADQYSFILFLSVGILPSAYWVVLIQFGAEVSTDTAVPKSSEFAFGQVLALFVAVPPIVAVWDIAKRFPQWFFALTWVSFLARRGQPRPSASSIELKNLVVGPDDKA